MSNNKLMIKQLPVNEKQQLVELTWEQAGDINGGYYYPLPIFYPTLGQFSVANQIAFSNNAIGSQANVDAFIANDFRPV